MLTYFLYCNSWSHHSWIDFLKWGINKEQSLFCILVDKKSVDFFPCLGILIVRDCPSTFTFGYSLPSVSSFSRTKYWFVPPRSNSKKTFMFWEVLGPKNVNSVHALVVEQFQKKMGSSWFSISFFCEYAELSFFFHVSIWSFFCFFAGLRNQKRLIVTHGVDFWRTRNAKKVVNLLMPR